MIPGTFELMEALEEGPWAGDYGWQDHVVDEYIVLQRERIATLTAKLAAATARVEHVERDFARLNAESQAMARRLARACEVLEAAEAKDCCAACHKKRAGAKETKT